MVKSGWMGPVPLAEGSQVRRWMRFRLLACMLHAVNSKRA